MKKIKSNILSIAEKVVTVSECEKNKEIISKTTNFAIMRQLLSRIVFVANSIIILHTEISVVDQELYFGISEKEFGRILCNNVSNCSSIEDKLSNALECVPSGTPNM